MSDIFKANMSGPSSYEGFDPLNEEQRRQLRAVDEAQGWTEEEDPDFESGIAIFQMGKELATNNNPDDHYRLRSLKISPQLLEKERQKQIELQKRRMAASNPQPPQQRVSLQPQQNRPQIVEQSTKKSKKSRRNSEETPQLELFSPQEIEQNNNSNVKGQLELNLVGNGDAILNRIISVEEEMVKIKTSYKNLEKSYEELSEKHAKMLEILQKMFTVISKKT